MKLGNSSRAMGVGAYFLKVFFVVEQVERSVCSGEWASWRVLGSEQVGAMGWCWKSTTCYRVALLWTQVAIFSVCNEWRICSVWQVAWERMNGCSYVIERTTQSSSLLREGGLRNDAARAALWRTRPYECAIDVCQLLTIVIADVCRECVNDCWRDGNNLR